MRDWNLWLEIENAETGEKDANPEKVGQWPTEATALAFKEAVGALIDAALDEEDLDEAAADLRKLARRYGMGI